MKMCSLASLSSGGGTLTFSCLCFLFGLVATAQAQVEISLGSFETRQHKLQGEVVLLSDSVFEVRNMEYDGLGPDAYFWADTSSTPSAVTGFRLLDGSPSNGCGQTTLPPGSGRTFRVEFPDGTTIYDIVGGSISVWCEAFSANFGEVVVDQTLLEASSTLPSLDAGEGPALECAATGQDPEGPEEVSLGNFETRQHKLQGEVVLLSDSVFEVRNMEYDGLGPDAYFWADTSSTPSAVTGFRLLDGSPSNGCGQTTLPPGSGRTFRVEFPDGTTIYDIVGGSISVWCEAFSANFGEVIVDQTLLEAYNTLPSLDAGEGPALECAEQKPSITSTPPMYNCEELTPDFQVRWKVVEGGSEIAFELIARIEDDEYMSFGVSGSATAAEMIGGDVVVADWFNGGARATDYFMESKGPCTFREGVCSDASAGGTNDIASNSVSGERDDERGLTLIRYRRSTTAPSDTETTVEGVVLDHVMPVTPGALTPLIWALGSVDLDKGLPFYHRLGVSVDLLQWELGRSPAVDNCMPLDATNDQEDVSDTPTDENGNVVPFFRPTLTNVEEFRATIGPSGGERGYSAITNGRAGWGIAWYLNDILLPVIELRRGTTYTFLVNGGDDPEVTSQYHPLYLTTSIDGGYATKTPAGRAQETVFEGISITEQDPETGNVLNFEPTAVGPLCSYTEADDSPEAAAGGFLEYFDSLDTSCSSDTTITSAAATLQFTPNETTPDLIYYQCVTHRNLGWEIHVIDADAPSVLEVNCDSFGSSPVQISDEVTSNFIVDPVQNTITVELVFEGLAWIAVAFTNGRPSMIGAEAVIAWPDSPNEDGVNPAKYHMNSKAPSGVFPMAAEQQTLMNATITQTETQTRLRFTKYLREEGEHPIFPDRKNTLLFAHGSSNAPGPHIFFGDLEILPNQCAVFLKGELQNANAIDQQGSVAVGVADLNRELWVAHGACAAIAWGILVPLAVGASLIRNVFVKILGLSPGTWFQLHRYLNILAALLTVVSFALGVRAINKGSVDGADPDHFGGGIKHRSVGLVIFLLTLIQAVNGFLRAPGGKGGHYGGVETSDESGNGLVDETKDNGETQSSSKNLEEDNEESVPVDDSKGSERQSDDDGDGGKSMVRICWECLHKVLGFGMLGLTWWQVQDGLGIFAERFDEDNLDTVFWIVVAILCGSLTAIAIFSRVALE